MAQNWKSWGWKLGVASLSAIGGAIASLGDCALAQITPDGTLGAESSVVIPGAPGAPVDVIEGGATRGGNLFHSFEQFSVPTGGEASFNNALDIQNIISRVTGGSVSNIDGLLRANGVANLFLINPNGIIFGPNASLNIGGSFVGSTASSLNFADSTQFSATAPQTTPLLTVSVPIGLQYGGTAGGIRSSGSFLSVSSGQSLLLLGGNVNLDGSFLFVDYFEGGRIELGGVSGPGTVGLNVDGNIWRLSFPDDVARADVSLTNISYVDVTAEDGGSIAINARNLDVSGESTLTAGILSGLGAVDSQAGDITLNATGALRVADRSTISNNVGIEGVGNAGNIYITAGSLSVTNGAFLNAGTFGQGDGGNLTVYALDSVQLTGTSADGNFPSFLSTYTGGTGKAGDLTINTPTLRVQDGAQVSVSTRGEGAAGTADINARSVEVSGSGSGLFNRTGSTGDAGTLKITTEELTVQNEAQVSVDNFIPIGFRTETRLDERGNPVTDERGNPVTIFVPIIERREGSGNAGNLEITADSIGLEDFGSITADSAGGNGGNIELRVENLVLLGNSNISTTAGTQEAPGNGGSITIDTDNLVALKDSDITADAFRGRGGQVEVTAQGIFGTESRDAPTLESDITATGASPELSGTVEINNPDVDPTQGLVELPAELVDASNQIAATGCPEAVWRGESKFIITGRGGLPPSPYEPLRGDNTLTNWSTLEEPDVENRSNTAPSTNSTIESAPTTIVEANGWVKGSNGEVTLVATVPTATLNIPWLPSSDCHAPAK